jgi:hypothetical protein
MHDLGALTQEAVLDVLSSAGDMESLLPMLGSSLLTIREAYRKGRPPPFENARIRAAYALGYFPHHAALAAASYGAAGLQMLGLKDGATVVVLGAGPGPEVVGLAQYLVEVGRRIELDVHLVDREEGWRATRAATIDAVLERMEGFDRSSFRIHTHEHDLGSIEGIRETAALLNSANLVVAETLLTELPTPSEDGHLVDWLIDRLPDDGRLLLIDLFQVRRHTPSQNKLESASHLECRLRSTLEFPAAKTLPVIRKNFFPKGEHPRARLNVSIALYSRPGCPVYPFVGSIPFEPNVTQEQALQKLRNFLQGPDRVFVLTGAAGTGKTSLFPAIVGLAQESGMCVELMAPTGQAARRLAKVSSLGASTVHSTIYTYAGALSDELDDQAGLAKGKDDNFELAPSVSSSKAEDPPVAFFALREPPEEAVVYIIDEASLIGNRAVEDKEAEVVFAGGKLLDDLLKFTLGHPNSRVIFVGDTEQLPPIGQQLPPALTRSELESLTGCAPCFATLTQVMRQDDQSGVLDLADRARAATIHKGLDTGPDDPEAGINLLRSSTPPGWVNDALIRGDAVVIAARNADVARWNRSTREAAQLPLDQPVRGDLLSVLRRDAQRNLLNGDDLVIEDLTDQVSTISIKGQTVTLREAHFRFAMHGVGPVIFNALYVEDLLYQASSEDHKRITRLLFIDFKIRHSELKPNTDAFNEAYEADSRVNALRVGYSYARTCHRAQGGEWPHVIVDFRGSRWLGPIFGRWAYTAVTRPKRSIWMANAPSASAPLGAEFLAEGAKSILQAISLEISAERSIQNGVQLEISGAGGTLRVNLYEKKGRASRVVITGGSTPEFTELALREIEGWIRETKIDSMDPLPDGLEKMSFALGSEFQQAGYDLTMQPYADYQVEFTLKGVDHLEATAVCSFKGDGRLTQIQRMEGVDLVLQQKLREALENALS